MNNGPVLATHNLCKYFGNKAALSDLTLEVQRGGVHAIIGSNGAGKSTLFRILLGFMAPSSGSSRLLGEDSMELPTSLRGRVGYVNEEHTLPTWLKVKQLKQMQSSYYPNWNEDIYRSVIANYGLDREQKVGSLSRGERAGFNLAMALAQGPELLILDEPTLGLDVVAKQEFLDSVLFCTQIDTTVIYCSHQMEEIERLADELIILERGQLKYQATPDEFSARVQMWIVEARFRQLVQDKVPQLVSGGLIEDDYHLFVLDAPDSFASQLALLGIRDAVQSAAGLGTAVRAFLAQNHSGVSS